MTIEELKAFLTENKDNKDVITILTEYVSKQELTTETVSQWLETDDGKKLLQPITDARITAALKTHEEKNAEKNKKKFDNDVKMAVDAEMLKRNPQETPAERMAREAKEESEQLRKEIEDERRQRRVEKMWLDAGHKPKFTKYLYKLPEEEASLFMREFSAELTELDKKVRNEVISAGFKPGSGEGHNGKPKVDLSKLSQAEMIKLETEHKLDEMLSNK